MKHTELLKLPLVLVSWNDAWIDGTDPVNPADVAASHKPKVIHTLGWLLRDDDVGVSLANENYDEDTTYRGRTFIPRAMIQSVSAFTLAKKRAKKAPNVEKPTSQEPS